MMLMMEIPPINLGGMIKTPMDLVLQTLSINYPG